MKSLEEQKQFYRGKCKYAWYLFKDKSDNSNYILCWADPETRKLKESYFVRVAAKNNGILDIEALSDVIEYDKLEAKLFQLGISDSITDEFKRCGSNSSEMLNGLGKFISHSQKP